MGNSLQFLNISFCLFDACSLVNDHKDYVIEQDGIIYKDTTHCRELLSTGLHLTVKRVTELVMKMPFLQVHII